jgi:hypothetical protein
VRYCLFLGLLIFLTINKHNSLYWRTSGYITCIQYRICIRVFWYCSFRAAFYTYCIENQLLTSTKHIYIWYSLLHVSAISPYPQPVLIDLFIYYGWVRTLTVPMHLGLIEGSFVPHNLISAQESPVPYWCSRWPPILMPSGSKKRNPDILFFSLKNPGKRTPSRFPNRAPKKRNTR